MENMPDKNKRATHQTVITWDKEKNTFMCSFGKQVIEIAASPESKTHEGMRTPEELFVDSIEGFIKETFMDSAKQNNLDILNYESEGQGIIDKVEGRLIFTEIKIWPRILISSGSQLKKTQELIEYAGTNCFISDYLRCEIKIYPEIKLEKEYD